MNSPKFLVAVMLAAAFAFIGCGGDSEKETSVNTENTADAALENMPDASSQVQSPGENVQPHSVAPDDFPAEDINKQIEWLAKNCLASSEASVQEKSYQSVVSQENNQQIPVTHWKLNVESILFNKNGMELGDVYFPGGKTDEQEMYFSNSPNDIEAGDSLIVFYGTYQDMVSPCSGAYGVLKIKDGVVDGTNLTVNDVKEIVENHTEK